MDFFLFFQSYQFILLDVVDEFLLFADVDKNGFLNYAEYVKAMKASSEEINASDQPLVAAHEDNNEV